MQYKFRNKHSVELLKIHLCVKIGPQCKGTQKLGENFVSIMGHFRLNIMLLTFAKFVEFLKSGAVKVVYTVTVFQPKDMLKFCLYFNESQLKIRL